MLINSVTFKSSDAVRNRLYVDQPNILVLPGGGPGAKTFSEDNITLDLIKKCRENTVWVACICAATTYVLTFDRYTRWLG